MKRIGAYFSFASLFVVATILTQIPIAKPLSKGTALGSKVPEVTRQLVVETYGRLPLSFEANQGQTDSSVKFLSRGSGYTLFLTATEAVLSLRSQESEAGTGFNQSRDSDGATTKPHRKDKLGPLATARGSDWLSAPSAKSVDETTVLRMKLVGANPNAEVLGENELPGKSNYFLGNDPKQWRTNVPTYAKVRYKDVYPGIDLVYYGNQRELEYDLVVAPGADPSVIQLAFEGQEKLSLDSAGDLVLETGNGSNLRSHKPLVYQDSDGVRREIAGSYVLDGSHGIEIKVGPYDANKPLVIDPALVYSSYLGKDSGSSFPSTSIGGIAVDSAGSVYLTGKGDLNSPAVNPIPGVQGQGGIFVTKINASGSAFVYSTYLASALASYTSVDAYAIAVDSAGNAYVTGRVTATSDSRFPVTSGAFQSRCGSGYRIDCAFVAKLDASGSALLFFTYLGGGSDEGRGIAVDGSGNIYVTGSTCSTNFPTRNAFQAAYGGGSCFLYGGDAFVTKLDATGAALVYSTYLGGASFDQGYGIALDAAGNAYVTGTTSSTNFPTTAGVFKTACTPLSGRTQCSESFVTKLNASGMAAVYSTYFGSAPEATVTGTGTYAYGVAVDSSGNAYLTGSTGAMGLPTVGALQPQPGGNSDAFVAKFDATASRMIYSTYLGGGGNDRGSGIAVDPSGNVYVTGTTTSANFPTESPLQFTLSNSFSGDAFITKINSLGDALVYSTYLGGGESAGANSSGIAVDASGNAYVAGRTIGCGGCQQAPAFPLVNALQTTPGFGFLAKIDNSPPSNPISTINSISPSSSTVSAAGFILTVTGSKFVSRSVVRWNGSDRTTTFVSATQLRATIPASDIAAVGTAQVTVFTPTPGGGISNAVTFTINPNPVPAITRITPTSIFVGGAGLTLTVEGSGFLSSSVVRWNGNARTTRFDGFRLTASIPASDIAEAGMAQITVFNPPPGGGTSNPVAFNVVVPPPSPVPTLSSLSPPSAVVGGSGVQLTATGTGFVSGGRSFVFWNGTSRPTAFRSSTQLLAFIPPEDIAAEGVAQVTVFNSAPGGGSSGALPFAINPPAAINPGGTVNGASFAAGAAVSPGSIVSAFGTNLAPGDITVRLNSIAAPVFAATATQVNFQVPVELAGQSQASLTVTVGGVTSSPVTVSLAAVAPGLFSANTAGQGAILIANTAFVAAPEGVFPGSRPVSRGGFISIFATGLGPVTNQPATGVAASGNPLSLTTTTPTVTVGGVPATVSFSGLSPGFFGLYQVNVEVPANAPTGSAVPVVLTIGGATSNTVTLAVQ